MRFSTISARFGHQFASVDFSRLVFAGDIKNSVFFSTRLLVSVDIGFVCSWVGVAGWDFPPYLRGLVINLPRFVSTMPVYAADIRNSIFFVKIASFRRYWSRLLLSWHRGMRFSTISPRFGHQVTTFVFLRLVFAGDIKNSSFFVKIASFRRHWSRLLLSWGREMWFSTISARFGHQFAMFCFDNARLRRRYQKQHILCLDC